MIEIESTCLYSYDFEKRLIGMLQALRLLIISENQSNLSLTYCFFFETVFQTFLWIVLVHDFSREILLLIHDGLYLATAFFEIDTDCMLVFFRMKLILD